ncbi:MAG TPA: hypothetical protein VMS37_34875 [Verrucomicrobiae bacterium]|nr:hypothetical protein [Verrucomicrobiae bacterium]
MKRVLRFVAAALAGFAVTAITVRISFALWPVMWRQSDNVIATIEATLPFAVLLGLIAAAWPSSWTDRKSRVVVAVLIGGGLALLYPFAAFRFGPLFGCCWLGLLPQILTCWVAAGVSAMLAITLTGRLTKAVSIVAICSAAILLPRPVFNRITHNQELTVAFVIRSSGTDESGPPRVVRIPETEVPAISMRVLNNVHAMGGLEGNYRLACLWRVGEGRKALAIVVLQDHVKQEVILNEPDGSTVVYVQGQPSWGKFPPTARTLTRHIRIWPPTSPRELTSFEIAEADGLTYLGGVE